ncbi:DNA-binding protein [Kitasatospora sp. NPDC004669]|uniref:DNA-binding protein n=1 Tax=Kitasatospora sp. NPDC004669 TaxID=3154555 RepID=UPI0033BDC13F
MTAPRTLLWILVDQQRWVFADFEREFKKVAGLMADELDDPRYRNLTVSEPTYRRWLAGKVDRPTGQSAQVLNRMFGRPAAELLAPLGEGEAPTPTQHDLESELAMTARDASDHAASVASAFVSDLSLDQIRDDLVQLARTYNNRPPYDVYRDTKVIRANAQVLLDRTHIPEQKQELLIILGQATALLSMTAFDLGSLGSATRLARSAAMYGEATRFDPLRAFAGGTLAMLAYWDGRPAEALQFIKKAQMFTGVGTAGRARIAAIEGRAYGHLGDAPRATRAVQRYVDLDSDERDDLHDGVGGEFQHSAARLARSHGTTFLLLRDGAAAQMHARRVLELQAALPANERIVRFEAEARADLAAALIIDGELDAAVEALAPIANLDPERRAAGLVERVLNVRRLLAQEPVRTAAAAVVLSEALEAYARDSAPKQLGPGAA